MVTLIIIAVVVVARNRALHLGHDEEARARERKTRCDARDDDRRSECSHEALANTRSASTHLQACARRQRASHEHDSLAVIDGAAAVRGRVVLTRRGRLLADADVRSLTA